MMKIKRKVTATRTLQSKGLPVIGLFLFICTSACITGVATLFLLQQQKNVEPSRTVEPAVIHASICKQDDPSICLNYGLDLVKRKDLTSLDDIRWSISQQTIQWINETDTCLIKNATWLNVSRDSTQCRSIQSKWIFELNKPTMIQTEDNCILTTTSLGNQFVDCGGNLQNEWIIQVDCAPGCSVFMLEDVICQPACNHTSCDYDHGACLTNTSGSILPTRSPTVSPHVPITTLPTASPTSYLTTSPTSSPTASPSFSPTISPTTSPTSSPTTSPTSSPTASPTSSPTTLPSISPSMSPTKAENISTLIASTTTDGMETGLVWGMGLMGLLLLLCCCFVFICCSYRRNDNKKQKQPDVIFFPPPNPPPQQTEPEFSLYGGLVRTTLPVPPPPPHQTEASISPAMEDYILLPAPPPRKTFVEAETGEITLPLTDTTELARPPPREPEEGEKGDASLIQPNPAAKRPFGGINAVVWAGSQKKRFSHKKS